MVITEPPLLNTKGPLTVVIPEPKFIVWLVVVVTALLIVNKGVLLPVTVRAPVETFILPLPELLTILLVPVTTILLAAADNVSVLEFRSKVPPVNAVSYTHLTLPTNREV